MADTRVYVIKDDVNRVVSSLRELISKQVLVGFPDVTAGRNQGGGLMNNATLGYIHEFGSPAANIPARPFLIPGIKKVEDETVRLLGEAALLALNKKSASVLLGRAGQMAASSARNAITNGDFAPLAPSTVAGRARKRGSKTRRKSEEEYLLLIALGATPAMAQLGAGIKPLIDTGQMLRAITYVVRNIRK